MYIITSLLLLGPGKNIEEFLLLRTLSPKMYEATKPVKETKYAASAVKSVSK
jgi:hypothetical protein